MKRNLFHFQNLNQENIQERRLSGITGHQITPPPPPQEPQQAEKTLGLWLSLGYNQPTPPPPPPQESQQAEETLDLRLSLRYNQPTPPPPPPLEPQQAEETLDLLLSFGYNQPTPPPPPEEPQLAEETLDLRLSLSYNQPTQPPPPPPSPPKEAIQAEATLDLRLSLGYNQPTPPPPTQEPQQAEATLDLRLSLGYNQPTQPPPQPQQADETASSSPPSETNQQDHEAMTLADSSSYPINALQSLRQSHATSRNHPRSQEMYYQECAMDLPPRTRRMESFYSSSSKELHHNEGQNEDRRVNLSLPFSPILPAKSAAFQDIASPIATELLQPVELSLTPPILRRQPLEVLPPRWRLPRLNTLRSVKTGPIPAPYPWATTRRATVHSLNHLLSQGINTISGEVQCEECQKQYEIAYDLQEKFMEVADFLSKNKGAMHDRAPYVWMNPVLPTCEFCKRSCCVWPVIDDRKRSINWLFLLLGQMLGVCQKPQLMYLCRHSRNIKTGTKAELLYLTYLGLCKQLDPDGPFDP